MNRTLLIHGLIRQTVKLVASLASTQERASLAGIMDVTFFSLIHELKQRGLSNKVIADMLGMPLSTYLQTLRRITDTLPSDLDKKPTLWQQIHDFIQQHGQVSREDVLGHFYREETSVVASILKDLEDNQRIYSTGPRKSRSYGWITKSPSTDEDVSDAIGNLVWIMIFHHTPVERAQLEDILRVDPTLLSETLDRLEGEGRVEREVVEGQERFSAGLFSVDASKHIEGWESAVFDHYRSMVHALNARLNPNPLQAENLSVIGGSTYTLGVWEGHPLEARVKGLLSQVREQVTELRQEVQEHRSQFMAKGESPEKTETLRTYLFYVGQTLFEP